MHECASFPAKTKLGTTVSALLSSLKKKILHFSKGQ